MATTSLGGAGALDRRIAIDTKSVTRNPDYGTEVVSWTTLATVWASVEDVAKTTPGGGEDVKLNERVVTLPVQIRLRYRSDLRTDMRVRLLDRNRTLQIVSIAEIGRRDGLMLVCEEYSA